MIQKHETHMVHRNPHTDRFLWHCELLVVPQLHSGCFCESGPHTYRCTGQISIFSHLKKPMMWFTNHKSTNLISTFTQLQRSKDLALNSLHPGIPLLLILGVKVPALSCAWYDDKVCILLLCNEQAIFIYERGSNRWKTLTEPFRLIYYFLIMVTWARKRKRKKDRVRVKDDRSGAIYSP